jgi:rare lipoprotein A
LLRNPLIYLILLSSWVSACASSPETYRSFPASSERWNAPSAQRPAAPGGRVDPTHLIASSSDHQKVGRPYAVSGRTYHPVRDDSYDEIGIASWYGPTFHGRPTANGEIFDQHQMTAAHTTLPIPSIAEVTNLENGRSIIVRINDRGPFVDDRIIDLSRAAATELDYIGAGLARVRVRYLGPAFANAAPPPRVWQNGAGNTTPVPVATPVQEVPTPIAHMPAVFPTGQSGVTLQVGAFSDPENAQRFADRLNGAGDVWVQAGSSDQGPVYRVYFGRWQDEMSASRARASLADWGIYESRLVALD